MLGSLLEKALGPILDGVLRLIPDKNERAKAEEMFKAQVFAATTALLQGQLEVNKVEATHKSVFVAGWRPFVGWVCGVALAYNFVVRPIALYVSFLFGVEITDAPQLDISELMTVLLGMLGLGAARSYEKAKGVASNNMGAKDG